MTDQPEKCPKCGAKAYRRTFHTVLPDKFACESVWYSGSRKPLGESKKCKDNQIARLKERNEDLVAAIRGSLRISDLWLPPVTDTDESGECSALYRMCETFREVLNDQAST